MTTDSKRRLIEPDHPGIPITRQCELLGLNRSSYYYGPAGETPENLLLMRLLDEQYTRTPFYGVPRMTAWLKREGHDVNHKRIERLMGVMGIHAVYPRKATSIKSSEHEIYPYLLRDVQITRPNQVWATDITYIRLKGGFLYLVAVMDWFSRYILSWSLSNTMDVEFCIEALEEALKHDKPEIFNSDQGSQFTSPRFTGILNTIGVKISMDGRGRCFDNIMIERLWRTLKYEEVYLKDYDGAKDAYENIGNYIEFYKNERLHQALDYKTPREVYLSKTV